MNSEFWIIFQMAEVSQAKPCDCKNYWVQGVGGHVWPLAGDLNFRRKGKRRAGSANHNLQNLI